MIKFPVRQCFPFQLAAFFTWGLGNYGYYICFILSVPEPYQKAIFTTFLASRFFYKQPFTADVSAFAFIAYLDEIREQMAAAEKKSN